jgi:hypothetical protein
MPSLSFARAIFTGAVPYSLSTPVHTEHLTPVENCAIHRSRGKRSILGQPPRGEEVYDMRDWAKAHDPFPQ